jgi:hypothetical protein
MLTLSETFPELEDFVIRRLAETANRNKVIEESCLKYCLHWGDATQIVDALIQSNHLDLIRRQSPYLILVALSIFVGGVFLVAWNLLGISNYFWPFFDPNTPDSVGLYLFYSDAFQILFAMSYATPLVITGLAMIAGSYFGMKDVWFSVFAWLDQPRVVPLCAGEQPITLAEDLRPDAPIERFPVSFGLFALGMVFLVTGFYTLKDLWSSIFLLRKESS